MNVVILNVQHWRIGCNSHHQNFRIQPATGLRDAACICQVADRVWDSVIELFFVENVCSIGVNLLTILRIRHGCLAGNGGRTADKVWSLGVQPVFVRLILNFAVVSAGFLGPTFLLVKIGCVRVSLRPQAAGSMVFPAKEFGTCYSKNPRRIILKKDAGHVP